MSNEIATYSMILSKLSLGKSGTECPTKTQILAINSLIVIDNASTYGANECVKIDDIRKKVETWNYYLTVSPTSMSFGAGGGSKTFTVSSYKRKVLDGVEQSGDTSVSLKSTVISGSGFSLSGTTVSASANEGTSNRTGTVTITQNESNKTATINVSQDAYVADTYVFTITPNTYDALYDSYTFIPRTVSTKNGSNIGYSLTSGGTDWVVVSTTGKITVEILKNTTSNTRSTTLVFTQNESGKTQSIKITQSGYTPTYTFNVTPTNLSVTAAETNETLIVNSYKTVLKSDGSKTTESLKYEFSSNNSWVAAARTTTNAKYITVAENKTTTQRTAKITLTQAESGAQAFVNVIQDAYVADTYVFTITPNTYDALYDSYTFIPRTVSTKNGSNIGYSLTSGGTDWVVVSTTGKITVEILKNTTSNTRSTTLVFTQNESGKTQSIKITQSGYTPTYTFNVTPTNLSVTAAETNETLIVNSYKTVLKSDGSKTTESLKYEFSSNNSWVAAARTTTNAKYITVAENKTTTQRTAKITLTQAESGAQAFVNVIQDGK